MATTQTQIAALQQALATAVAATSALNATDLTAAQITTVQSLVAAISADAGVLTPAITPLSIAAPNPSLLDVDVDVAVSFGLNATGGSGAITFMASGLPPGLSLSGCLIQGTPTTAGSYRVTVTATDSGTPAQVGTVSFTMSVATVVTTLTLAAISSQSATVGVAFEVMTSVSGGTTPYGWSATGLPAGLTLNGGNIIGTPTTAGTSTVTVTVTDSSTPTPQTASQSFSITVAAASPTVPGAPTSLAATALVGAVNLGWDAPASNGGSTITGYKIFSGSSSGGESSTPLATVSGTTLTYSDSTASGDTYYKVKAVNAVGTSSASNEANATPLAPSAPTISNVGPHRHLTRRGGGSTLDITTHNVGDLIVLVATWNDTNADQLTGLTSSRLTWSSAILQYRARRTIPAWRCGSAG